MSRTYWITRESAAKILWISTRTIDRYIKSWKLSYKKVANKVLLAKEEIASLQEDYGALHQEVSTELVKEHESPKTVSISNPSLEKAIDEENRILILLKKKN